MLSVTDKVDVNVIEHLDKMVMVKYSKYWVGGVAVCDCVMVIPQLLP